MLLGSFSKRDIVLILICGIMHIIVIIPLSDDLLLVLDLNRSFLNKQTNNEKHALYVG